MTQEPELPMPLAWMPVFLTALAEHGVAAHAAKRAGIVPGSAYCARRRYGAFDRAWREALAQAQPRIQGKMRDAAGAADTSPAKPASGHWRPLFFEALAETSNVTVSAVRSGVPPRTVYKLRREDAAFAGRWRTALMEGYDNLEMELLGYLRDPAATRRMDVAAGMRLLEAHRETVARERALREDDDEQEVLESINRFIDGIRERREANAAIGDEDLQEAGDDAQ
jgi:hypothetical protein